MTCTLISWTMLPLVLPLLHKFFIMNLRDFKIISWKILIVKYEMPVIPIYIKIYQCFQSCLSWYDDTCLNLGPVYGDIQPHYVYPRDLGSSKTGFASIHISFLSRASVNFSICTEIKTQTENCRNYQNRPYHQRVHQNITTFSSYKFENWTYKFDNSRVLFAHRKP